MILAQLLLQFPTISTVLETLYASYISQANMLT